LLLGRFALKRKLQKQVVFIGTLVTTQSRTFLPSQTFGDALLKKYQYLMISFLLSFWYQPKDARL